MELGDIIVALAIGLPLVALVVFLFVVFRRHNPARARAMTEVTGEGTFALEVDGTGGGAVFFRFQINGWTDDGYDLVVSGEVVQPSGDIHRFAWKTSNHSAVPGAASARGVQTVTASDHDMGSFQLAKLPPGPARVQGKVAVGSRGLLARGWVYVPR